MFDRRRSRRIGDFAIAPALDPKSLSDRLAAPERVGKMTA